MSHRILPSIVLLLAAPQVGYGIPDQPPAPTESQKPTPPVADRNPKIPAEVSYPIIKDEEVHNAFGKNRMVEVRLNTRVSPEVLRDIGMEIKAGKPGSTIGRLSP